MNKGNVLVIGNSGVGKSTLINAVLGEQVAKTSWGTEGTTKELKIYEKERVPFRIIDTAGFEPSILKEMQAINAVKRWSRESTKEGKEDTAINIIWFCIDGTSRKLFIKTIKDLSSATKIFKTVPVVVVITKSYSVLERSENIEMVQNAFANQKLVKNLKKIIPVVAETYKLNDTAYAAPEGITELIDKRDIGKFKLSRKNALSQGLIASATLGGIAVGAIPIPFADAAILSPVEVGLVNGLASIYEIGKNEKSNNFINSIINVGTVSVVAKGALSAIKAIPGINIAVSALNAIIAGLFVTTIGETSKYLFEQVYLGEKTVEDIDWATKILESKLTNEMVDKFNKVVSKLNGKYDKDSIGEAIKEMFTK